MSALLTLLLAAAQLPVQHEATESGGTAWLVATVGHSEWCPAGNVRLDLETGDYAFTARAPRGRCGESGLERPVIRGRLDGTGLAYLRAAFDRALADGLEDPACRSGVHPERTIISNAGTPILVLTNGAVSRAAPDDLSCWSGAANVLHDALDRAFDAREQR